MRKTLLQTLCAAFSAILATAPLEGGGVMLIGMRNAMLSGGWKNPYVTDGLVAMWDGEWNAGPGVHDASATKWTDIVGGVEATLGTGQTFDANTKALIHRFASGRIFFYPTGMSSLTNRTYEFAFKSIEFTGTDHWFFCADTTNNGFKTQANKNSNQYLIGLRNASKVLVLYDANGNKGVNNFSTYGAVSISNNGGSQLLYSSGKSSSGNIAAWTDSSFGLPYHQQTANKFNVEFYAFRVYSRALTAAEIAANYAVDKARFNLPDAT